LQQARQHQQSDTFRLEYAARAGIESTHAALWVLEIADKRRLMVAGLQPASARAAQYKAMSLSLFLYRVLTQVWCKLMEDFEKGAERGDLNALRVGRIDLGTRRVAGCTNSSGGEQVNLY
jgi:hypothetical protein